MHGKPPSLIRGLDPAALLALDEDESAGTEWQPPSLEEAARLFPQWKVIRLLGRGGMGAVYEMHQPELDRTVAVKLLPIEASGDEHLVERFRREARTLAKLHHPGIVALFESGMTAAGHFYFVMEHVNGSPLSQWISEGRLSVAKAIEIVRQVCDALAYAHAQGVIHRDIKPSNILLDAQGRAKVADFGLARLEQAQSASGALTVSHTGQFMGTPAYAAPEQVKDAAHVDHRADIYALGVLLYEMLTGDLPRGVFQPPSRKSGSDAHLDEVVRRAMQERPEDRYQAAAELQQDISRKRKGGKAWLLLFMVVIAGAGVMWV
ncbi:MAG: serine/threonine protein kinase, partial [Verrucomicrobiaceae bacterium]|nr:serine/threonine protein kinase [Verrucomicrobiaceae bacterium]